VSALLLTVGVLLATLTGLLTALLLTTLTGLMLTALTGLLLMLARLRLTTAPRLTTLLATLALLFPSWFWSIQIFLISGTLVCSGAIPPPGRAHLPRLRQGLSACHLSSSLRTTWHPGV